MTFQGTRAKSLTRFDLREAPVFWSERIVAQKCDVVVDARML